MKYALIAFTTALGIAGAAVAQSSSGTAGTAGPNMGSPCTPGTVIASNGKVPSGAGQQAANTQCAGTNGTITQDPNRPAASGQTNPSVTPGATNGPGGAKSP